MNSRIALICLLVASGPAAAQVLTYEKTFSMVAGDNRLTITIAADGEMSIHRPEVMTRSGDYRGTAPATTYSDLAAELSLLATRAPSIEAEVRQRAAQEARVITDQDLSVFRLRDPGSGQATEIRFRALQPWAGHYRDDQRLRRLADLERRIWQLMDAAMREAGHE